MLRRSHPVEAIEEGHDIISPDQVEGSPVYNAVGDKFGSIDDWMIDKGSGQVRYAALGFGGFLGMGTDRYRLPWRASTYDTSLGGYVVPLDKERLERAPHYSEEAMPPFTTDYGRRVHDFYGIDRRISKAPR
jgi:hypothetical protein